MSDLYSSSLFIYLLTTKHVTYILSKIMEFLESSDRHQVGHPMTGRRQTVGNFAEAHMTVTVRKLDVKKWNRFGFNVVNFRPYSQLEGSFWCVCGCRAVFIGWRGWVRLRCHRVISPKDQSKYFRTNSDAKPTHHLGPREQSTRRHAHQLPHRETFVREWVCVVWCTMTWKWWGKKERKIRWLGESDEIAMEL